MFWLWKALYEESEGLESREVMRIKRFEVPLKQRYTKLVCLFVLFCFAIWFKS